MHFKLKTPCKDCPFRCDRRPFLTRARADEIAASLDRASFPCHKTLDYNHDGDEGEGRQTPSTAHCAGALIMREHMERPGQMMRIAERLGLYDRRKLDMDAPVFHDEDSFVDAQPR